MVNKIPVQGDIIKINLNPKQGHEQQGYRPYICLSNKIISDIANIAVFAPISNTKRNYPFFDKGCFDIPAKLGKRLKRNFINKGAEQHKSKRKRGLMYD